MAAEEICSDNCSLERAKVSEPAQASSTCPVSHRMTQSRRGPEKELWSCGCRKEPRLGGSKEG